MRFRGYIFILTREGDVFSHTFILVVQRLFKKKAYVWEHVRSFLSYCIEALFAIPNRAATPGGPGTPPDHPGGGGPQPPSELPKGPRRMNTLWGALIRDHAKMCIPDLDVFAEYPIDYKFPAFARNRKGELISSGFFPADPVSLHTHIPLHGSSAASAAAASL